MKEINIGENEAGQRFDKLLGKYLNEAPKSFIYKMLRKKNITLNGKKASGNEKLVLGDSVKLFLADETIEKFTENTVQEVKADIKVIYEDKNILVINKPGDMLSQKAKAEDISLVEHIIAYMLETKSLTQEDLKSFHPSICNRLDRNTSGIVVAGKSLIGLQTMGNIFKKRSLHKFYRCIVAGEVQRQQYIKGYLSKNEKMNKVVISKEKRRDALPIETEYTPLVSNGIYTLLEVRLITGRSHQIRAHLSAIGHPIIGDFKYGTAKVNKECKAKYGLSHQLLHSYRLEMPELEGALSNLSRKVWIAEEPDIFRRIQKDMSLEMTNRRADELR
jgi:23S rRNA pseudouridine955/2504/2580 synthase